MKETEEYLYNDFNYLIDYNNTDEGVKIEHNKEKPEYLYKYYSVTEYSVDALKKNYLYASHPLELNDVLDCNPLLWITNEEVSFLKFKKILFPDNTNIDELKELYEHDKEHNFRFYCNGVWNALSNLYGIISLTENKNCPLMWPHYTQEKGFQLRFKTSSLIEGIKNENDGNVFKGLNPINYTEELSAINLNDFKQPHIAAYYMMNIKNSKWSYEDEWRIIVSKSQMGVPFSKGGWLLRDDYKTDKENRYANYGVNQVIDITLGSSFFNTRDYNISKIGNKKFLVKMKDVSENWNSENQLNFLNFIESNFQDKIYQTGVKYEEGEKAEFKLTRTRELLKIAKETDDSFTVEMTGDFMIYK